MDMWKFFLTRRRFVFGTTLIVALAVIATLGAFTRTSAYALYRAGRSGGESTLACIWALATTDFAQHFDERKFVTIGVGDSQDSVQEKIGTPRHKWLLPEWFKRKGELWVYGNISWDSANIVFFVRNVEIDTNGKVANVDSILYWD